MSTTHTQALSKSRGWLIFSGILSIFVGFFAMGAPLLFSVVIAQVLGIFALVSGSIALVLALFGKHQHHRILEAILAVIRMVVGVVLLSCIQSSIAVITLILAIFFVIEGIHAIVGAIQMRAHNGWVWSLINGLAALILGLMVWARWPSDSAAVLGLLYGINSLFWGASILALGFGTPRQPAA